VRVDPVPAIPASRSTCSPCPPSSMSRKAVKQILYRECRSRRMFEVEETYNVRQHGASEEDHVSSPRGIFDADFEFLQ